MHARLLTLRKRGYLTHIKLPQQKHIYALGRRALPVLVEQGIGSDDLLSLRLRTHELKPLFLEHEMMLVDFHVMLQLACASAGELRLIDWREGPQTQDSVSFIDEHGRRTTLPVRPDAIFTIEDARRPAGENRINYFFEADRATMAGESRFSKKITAYWHFRQQSLHSKKFGMKTFRVLTVTTTDKRAENLGKLAASLLPEGGRKFYFFTSLKHFSLEKPHGVLGEVYITARSVGSDVRLPLIPPLSVP
jgi:Replication-relaxation